MAWNWTLNWGTITPDLIVGTCPMSPSDLERIVKGTGATAVLSLQHDECLLHFNIDYMKMKSGGEALGLAMVRCPIRDFDPRHTRERLPTAIRSLAALRAEGHRTYVHCTAGISRAPLTVFGYLTLIAGMPEARARELIMTGRPESTPYWEAYAGAREDILLELDESIERRTADLLESGVASSVPEARRRAELEIIRAALSTG